MQSCIIYCCLYFIVLLHKLYHILCHNVALCYCNRCIIHHCTVVNCVPAPAVTYLTTLQWRLFLHELYQTILPCSELYNGTICIIYSRTGNELYHYLTRYINCKSCIIYHCTVVNCTMAPAVTSTNARYYCKICTIYYFIVLNCTTAPAVASTFVLKWTLLLPKLYSLLWNVVNSNIAPDVLLGHTQRGGLYRNARHYVCYCLLLSVVVCCLYVVIVWY